MRTGERLQGEMDKLIDYRTKLQNKIRRASPAEKETLRREKSGVTERLTELAKAIETEQRHRKRSVKIQEKTDMLYANEYRAKEEMQHKKSTEERSVTHDDRQYPLFDEQGYPMRRLQRYSRSD